MTRTGGGWPGGGRGWTAGTPEVRPGGPVPLRTADARTMRAPGIAGAGAVGIVDGRAGGLSRLSEVRPAVAAAGLAYSRPVMAAARITYGRTVGIAGFSEVRAVVGPAGLRNRPVAARAVVRTEMIRPVLGLHRRTRHGAAVMWADVVPAVIGGRSPRGDVVIRADQADGINRAAERVIGIDGPASVISVNGIAGVVIHVGHAGAAAAVGA